MQKTAVAHLFLSMLFLAVFPLAAPAEESVDTDRLRNEMVETQILGRGLTQPRVIEAMRKVPRHLFVPESWRAQAYEDHPLPIGMGQTISQPFIVAFMAAALDLKPDDKVLEVGTGSGYAAAVLAEIAGSVYTIEILEPLAEKARVLLAELGYERVYVKTGDGYLGWPEEAPFDAMIVSCAPDKIPGTLLEQLAEGGRIIIPVGEAGGVQKLVKGIRQQGRLSITEAMNVRFVPMIHAPAAPSVSPSVGE